MTDAVHEPPPLTMLYDGACPPVPARFHVRGSDGQLLSGAQAFLALWARRPAG